MINQEHVAVIVADIRDCARRAREIPVGQCYKYAAELLAVAREIEEAARKADSERPSLPPALVENQEVRATASKHFTAARELLSKIRR